MEQSFDGFFSRLSCLNPDAAAAAMLNGIPPIMKGVEARFWSTFIKDWMEACLSGKSTSLGPPENGWSESNR